MCDTIERCTYLITKISSIPGPRKKQSNHLKYDHIPHGSLAGTGGYAPFKRDSGVALSLSSGGPFFKYLVDIIIIIINITVGKVHISDGCYQSLSLMYVLPDLTFGVTPSWVLWRMAYGVWTISLFLAWMRHAPRYPTVWIAPTWR